jgi:hypothetical protein
MRRMSSNTKQFKKRYGERHPGSYNLNLQRTKRTASDLFCGGELGSQNKRTRNTSDLLVIFPDEPTFWCPVSFVHASYSPN